MNLEKTIAIKILADGAQLVDLNVEVTSDGRAEGYAIAIRNHEAHRYNVKYDDATGDCYVGYAKNLGC